MTESRAAKKASDGSTEREITLARRRLPKCRRGQPFVETYRWWPRTKAIPRGWQIERHAHEVGHHGRYSVLLKRKPRKAARR